MICSNAIMRLKSLTNCGYSEIMINRIHGRIKKELILIVH